MKRVRKAVSPRLSWRKAREGKGGSRRKTIKSNKTKWKGRGGTRQGQKGKRGRRRHSLKYVNCPGGRNEDSPAPRSWGGSRPADSARYVRREGSGRPREAGEARS